MGIGDELMAAGQARKAHEQDPRGLPVRILDRNGAPRWHPIWDGLPYITRSSPCLDITNGPNVRPYISKKTAQRWTWREFRPPPGEIRFTQAERDFGLRYGGRVILEPHNKQGASPNKQWGWLRWNKLAWLLQARGVKVTQLGPPGTQLLDGGVEHVVTADFRFAAAVLAQARAAVLPEGGLHHAAAAVGTPAVVIFGAYISPAVTGYETQVNLFAGEGLGCGMRRRCGCCNTAMSKIHPKQVAEHLLGILNERVARAIPA